MYDAPQAEPARQCAVCRRWRTPAASHEPTSSAALSARFALAPASLHTPIEKLYCDEFVLFVCDAFRIGCCLCALPNGQYREYLMRTTVTAARGHMYRIDGLSFIGPDNNQ